MEERLCVKCGARVFTNDPMCVLCSSLEMDDDAKIYARYNVAPNFAFNWGAFALPFLWSIAMKQWLWACVWVAGNVMLSFLLPLINLLFIFNIFLGIYLGKNGNSLAYSSRDWRDNIQFNVTQSTWNNFGIGAIIVYTLSCFVAFVFFTSFAVKVIQGDVKMPNSPWDAISKSFSLSDKGSDLSSQVFHYFMDHDHKLPTNLTSDWAAKQSEKIYTNPYTEKPAKQVPYGEWSLGDYSYLLEEKVFKNGGKVGDDFYLSYDSSYYLIVVYGNEKNRYRQEVTGYKSDGIVYQSIIPMGGSKERIFVDTISKERFRITSSDYDSIHIETTYGNGYGK